MGLYKQNQKLLREKVAVVQQFPQQSAGVPFSCCCVFDCEHPCFWYFNSTLPVDIIRVKSNVDSFFDPMCVPLRSINLTLFPNQIVAGLVGVFRNGGGLVSG